MLYQLVKAVTKSLGLMLPERFQGVGGVVKSGVMGTAAKRILIDQAIPTDKILEHKRPDLTRVVIFEVACASDPLVGTREKEKRTKYQELAADLVNQWPGFRAIVIQAILRAPLPSVGPGVSVYFPPRVGFAGAVVLRRERQSKPGYCRFCIETVVRDYVHNDGTIILSVAMKDWQLIRGQMQFLLSGGRSSVVCKVCCEV